MAPGTRQNISRPVIGVTGNNKTFSPSWICIRISLFLAGGKGVRISTTHHTDLDSLDGLIISGGDDIHPSLYNADAIPKARYDRERDELEQRHIRYALRGGLPMLGICRGYQLINVTCGGTLFSDIRKLRQQTSNFNTILPRKTVTLDPDSLFARVIDQTRIRINSLHHQAIDKLAEHFSACGFDLDQFIQAIETTDNRKIIGVQWHPEYLLYRASQRRLFHWLVTQSQRSAASS